MIYSYGDLGPSFLPTLIKHTDETKAAMSKSNVGSQNTAGCKQSDVTKALISAK
jgi:hypothetical protein